MNVHVIHEDNHLLVIDKPSGLPSQGDKTGDDSAIDVCTSYVRKKYNKPGNVFMGLAHRLDRPVSGVLMLCKTSKSLSRMTTAFRERQVEKQYVAIVEGVLGDQHIHLEHYLLKNSKINRSRVVPEQGKNAKLAILDIHCLATTSTHSLVRLHPLTGRSHQLRTQLAHIGHPIVGDVKYGAQRHDDRRAICLHSASLSFLHPTTKKGHTLTSMPRQAHWLRYGTLMMHLH